MNAEQLTQLREVVEAEYRERVRAIDTLLAMLQGREARSVTELVRPKAKNVEPKKARRKKAGGPKMGFSTAPAAEPVQRKPREGGETTVAGAMRQYIGENPGRTRKQVVAAMLYSNKGKNADSIAAGLSVLIRQGDVEERDDGLYPAKK